MDKGVGKGITAYFPITIFKLKDGVTYSPKDPNYDLRLLSEKTTAKRQSPNYSNLDAPYNLKYYKEGHPETEVAYMGMAHEDEVVYVYRRYTAPFTPVSWEIKGRKLKDVWFDLELKGLKKKEFDDTTKWMDLEEAGVELFVYDSVAGKPVKVKKMMRCISPAKGETWCHVDIKQDGTDSKKTLTLTTDHPLCAIRDNAFARIKVSALKEGDRLQGNIHEDFELSLWRVEKLSLFNSEFIDGYDFETESDRFDLGPIVSHNCRTRVIANVNGPEIVTGRGNLSFTTINLPRLAIEARREALEPELREGIFFEKLEKVMAIAAKQLQERFELQCKRHVYNFPYVMQQGAYMGSEYLAPTDTIEKAILNGTLSFGFVGLAETLVALTGHDHADGEEYQQLGLRIVKYMRDYADKLTQERHMNWTLIATPAESVAGRFLRLDRAKYGIIEGVTDKDYYTNSNHVPVGKKVTASEKIRIEAPYHALTNAGHIGYLEIDGDPRDNLDAIHTYVNQMHDAGMGYFAFNAKVDTCTACGFTGIIGDTCPSCGQKGSIKYPIVRPRRVSGYLSSEDRFNSAKLAELHDRTTHV